MSKGLVVPDNPTPEDYIIVPFRIPNDPQWFGIIAGLLYSPCNGYWWKKSSGDWESARDTMCQLASEFSLNLTEFCDQVELCIDTNDGVREIIREIIRETIIGDPTLALGIGIPSIDTCSPDHIFGAVTELVDYFNTVIIDTLEIIESATNVLEAVNLWFDNQPIPTGALASKLIETIDWIISTISETYAANYTSTLRDKYRCDLFCLWTQSENCQLSMADVTGYFSSLIQGYDPFASYIDTLEYFVSEVWLGDEIPAIMHYLVSAAMTAVDAIGFFEFTGIKNYQTAIALGANNPDPDWSILCDCTVISGFNRCWYGINTGNNAEFPAVPFAGNGGYSLCTASVDGSNVLVGCYNGLISGVRVWSAMARYDVPAGVETITRISMSYETNANTYGGTNRGAIEAYNSSDVKIIDTRDTANSSVFDWNGNRDDIAYIRVYVRCYRTDISGYARINGIRIEGTSSDYPSLGCE